MRPISATVITALLVVVLISAHGTQSHATDFQDRAVGLSNELAEKEVALAPGLKIGQLLIPAGIRVMVFSPHPDDETLAAGGLIQRVVENGGKVRVVFVTNGDGYPHGVRLETGRSRISKEDFIEYGMRRHKEALSAIGGLGLQPSDAVFLGFPDQGIDVLWDSYWSALKPFTSPYTRRDRPYMTSLRAPVKYDGVDLDGGIEQAIRDFGPDWVILPDPRDTHPDHAATGDFVLKAFNHLSAVDRKMSADTQLYTYLVHYPGYPDSRQWLSRLETSARNSPASVILSSTGWLNFSLSLKEMTIKKAALKSYKTQFLVLGRLMRQFLRPSELFGRLQTSQIIALARTYEPRSKEVSK